MAGRREGVGYLFPIALSVRWPWAPDGVRVYDFKDKHLGKVIPRGVYDLTWNEGWVSVGVDHDTAQFAAETLRRWWQEMGSEVYPAAQGLLITADSGGSNSHRSRLWKVAIQELADLLGFPISVCHFPPGTSKWNQIEHRMFCHRDSASEPSARREFRESNLS